LKVLYVTLFIVIFDQITKLAIKGFDLKFLGFSHNGMDLYSSMEIIDGFLRFTFVENPGMAFGINLLGDKLFFTLFSILASIGILVYLYKMRKETLWLKMPLAIILGGAFGNLIDRVFYGILYDEGPLFYGKVVDFIELKFFRMEFFGYQLTSWPVFNVSDIAVSIGVIVLIVFHGKISRLIDKNEEPILKVPTPEFCKSIPE
jgi:signal peptidase II